MRDVELYRALLGLTAPWRVADVDVDLKGQRVVVRVEAGPGPYPCPECGMPTGRYDSKPRRSPRSSSLSVRVPVNGRPSRATQGHPLRASAVR